MSTSDSDTEPDPSPVPQSIIDALPVAAVADPSLLCAVCTDALPLVSPARSLPCGHVFHTCCIEPWLLRRNSCPLCRSPLPQFRRRRRRRRGEDDEAARAERAVEAGRALSGISSRTAETVLSAQVILAAVRAMAVEESGR